MFFNSNLIEKILENNRSDLRNSWTHEGTMPMTKKKESTEQTDFSIELHEFMYLFIVSGFGGYVLKEDVTKEQLLDQLYKLVKAAKEI